MAKFLSQVYTQIRGSVGGITYLTTPAGAMIARARVIPVNTPTPYRSAIQGAFTAAVSGWQALPVAKRLLWSVWAQANGGTRTGREEFMAGGTFKEYGILTVPTGWPVIVATNDPPTFVGHPSITFISVPFITAALTGCSFQVQNNSALQVAAICEISPALSTARNYWKGPWLPVFSLGASILPGVKKKFDFSGLIAGERYFARVRVMTNVIVPPAIACVVSPSYITYGEAVTNP